MGSIITATNGVATSLKDGNKIEAKSFEYDKKLSILTASNAIASFKTNPIKISANIIKYDNSLSMISAYGNVEIVNASQKILIKSEKITYNENSQSITSSEQSKITDEIGNIFTVKNFVYKINDLLIKIDEGHLIDAEKNVLKIDKAYLDLDLNRFIGKDISIDFNNQMLSEENQPRLKSKLLNLILMLPNIKKVSLPHVKKMMIVHHGKCLQKKSNMIKSKKTIYYDNAWLKIYDVPVLYFPRFFHPDPTVKKQSGFLMPSIDSSNSIGTSFYSSLLSCNF